MGRSYKFISIVLIAFCLFANSFATQEELGTAAAGIDFGSSTTCVGVYMNDHFEIIPNDQGNRTTPSWVAFTDTETLIGEAAKNQAAVNPKRTIFDVKRLIGRKFEDEEVQRVMKLVPYKIVNKDGKPFIQVEIKDGETKVFSPEEISAMILTKMKETAEAFLGKKVTDVFVPVPDYFNDAQRQATKDAALMAGFSFVKVIDEPASVAYAYGLHYSHGEQFALVFDLGEKTFDVSVLAIEMGIVEILSTIHTRLGGEDFNQRIVEHLIKLIKNKYGKNDIRMEAERLKRALSSQLEVSVFEGVDLLTRDRFEELNEDLFRKTLGPVTKAIEDSGLKKDEIDHIILVGGSSNIPKLQQLLKDYFDGKEPRKSVNPDEAVVFGAAVGAYHLAHPFREPMC